MALDCRLVSNKCNLLWFVVCVVVHISCGEAILFRAGGRANHLSEAVHI